MWLMATINNKQRKLFLSALMGVALLVFAVALHHHLEGARTLRAIAQAKALCGQIPTGTPRADVENVLERRGIEHSYSGDSRDLPEYAHTESAIIRNVCGAYLVTCDVVFSFKFDDRDLLKDCSAKDIYSGL